ncbi:hypothetical protein IL306_000323 [Fusarium sp. DS 682]|nr:hypothetical protein IL306_000323 [Fusarium sp. DS 682]
MNGQALESLKTAKDLLEVDDLTAYHAAHLHTKLAEVPEMGVYHAGKALELYTNLAASKPNDRGMAACVESAKKLLNQQLYEEWDFREHSDHPDTLVEAAARQQRYNEYFLKLEQEAKPSAADEKKDRDDPNPEVYLPSKKKRSE